MSASGEHVIRLAGPWQVRAERAGSGELLEREIRVQSPGDWTEGWTGNSFAGKLVLKRHFHWTFPDRAPARVELVVVGLPPSRIWLNGKPMARREGIHEFRCPVTRYLQPENELELEYHFAEFRPGDEFLREVQLLASD